MMSTLWPLMAAVTLVFGLLLHSAITQKKQAPINWLMLIWVVGMVGLIIAPVESQDLLLMKQDGLSWLGQVGLWLHLLLFVALAYPVFKRDEWPQHEALILLVLSYIGMLVLVCSDHLLLAFLGLELMSLPLYALVALKRDKPTRLEAAMKYFITGSVASLFMLLGFSLIYGAGGSLVVSEIINRSHVFSTVSEHTLLLSGWLFVLSGLFFKMGLFPFHWWVPDVYEGAPPIVTTLIASAPKWAVTILAIRWMDQSFGLDSHDWGIIVLAVGLASVIWGNLLALAQNSLMRLLAYSSISHMGFVVLALHAQMQYAPAALFYVLIYMLMSTLSFGQLAWMPEVENLENLEGTGKHHFSAAWPFSVQIFALAGLPPLAGFMAKVAVFQDLIQRGYTAVSVAVVLMTVLGAFYYMRLIKKMFFLDSVKEGVMVLTQRRSIFFAVGAVSLIVIGVFPSSVFHWVQGALVQ